MKTKSIIITISCLLAAVALIGCGNKTSEEQPAPKVTPIVDETIRNSPSDNDGVQKDIAETPEIVVKQPTAVPASEIEAEVIVQTPHVENVFFNSQPDYVVNSIYFTPHEIWYENGSLYAVMFVTNGYDNTQFDIRDVYIQLSNSQGIIAKGDFGMLQGLTLVPGQTGFWTFIFSDGALKEIDADLTGRIYTEAASASSY